MKRLWVILFVVPIFAQNPCNDEEYQRIKNSIEDYGYESISSREWDYFQLKDEQCSKFPEYKNLKIKEKEPVEPIDLTKGDDCILTLLLMGFGVALVIIFSP